MSRSHRLGLDHNSGWSSLSSSQFSENARLEEEKMDYGMMSSGAPQSRMQGKNSRRSRRSLPAAPGGYAPSEWQGDPLLKTRRKPSFSESKIFSRGDAFDDEFDEILAEDDAFESEDSYGSWYGSDLPSRPSPPRFNPPPNSFYPSHPSYGAHGYGASVGPSGPYPHLIDTRGANAPVMVQSPPSSPFVDNMKMGFGVGLGFIGAALGVNILLGSGRR